MKKFVIPGLIVAVALVAIWAFRPEAVPTPAPETAIAPAEKPVPAALQEAPAPEQAAAQRGASGILAVIDDTDPLFVALRQDLQAEFLASLQLMQAQYELPAPTLRTLASALGQARAAQLLYESRHMATFKPLTQDVSEVTIAPYPDEGLALMHTLEMQVQAILPDAEQAERFWDIEVTKAFEHFGTRPKSLRFNRGGSARSDGAVEIINTVQLGYAELRTDSYYALDRLAPKFRLYRDAIPQ